jgi:hypothetical protein
MPRVFAAMLVAALALAPCAAYPQDESAYKADKPRSQQDIIREREKACQGLKGEARMECLANYVGPREEKTDRGSWKRPPNPPRPQGRN